MLSPFRWSDPNAIRFLVFGKEKSQAICAHRQPDHLLCFWIFGQIGTVENTIQVKNGMEKSANHGRTSLSHQSEFHFIESLENLQEALGNS
jgi:hypothetical protein